jgi:hypothetical protein
MAGIRNVTIEEFQARRLDWDTARTFRPGEVIIVRPYVWAGPKEEAFAFGGVNYAAPLDVLDQCTVLSTRDVA